MGFYNTVRLILEQNIQTRVDKGIVFRGNAGCCIGVEHGKGIQLSQNIIDRIKQIPNVKFYAEGVAAKDYGKEPGMIPFMQENGLNYPIQKLSWDDITEKKNKGTANIKYNVVYIFMQHEYNKIIDQYAYEDGTMLDALSRPATHWPKNSPKDYGKRLQWIVYHVKKAGFYDKLNQPYAKDKLFNLLTEMESTVYPNGQEHPDTSTYFGQLMHKLEQERNQTIYDLMGIGGCCFAGAGHLVELKQQFSDLEYVA